MIRPGTVADIAYIGEQLKEFARTTPRTHSLYVSDEYTFSRLTDLIENHVVVVADTEVGPVGFIIGVITPNVMNPDITQLVEIIWWVEPELRGTPVGGRLLKAFVVRGKEVADWVMVSICGMNKETDSKSLERAGFHLVERQFLMEVT